MIEEFEGEGDVGGGDAFAVAPDGIFVELDLHGHVVVNALDAACNPGRGGGIAHGAHEDERHLDHVEGLAAEVPVAGGDSAPHTDAEPGTSWQDEQAVGVDGVGVDGVLDAGQFGHFIARTLLHGGVGAVTGGCGRGTGADEQGEDQQEGQQCAVQPVTFDTHVFFSFG